jgi:hypothetical protein
MFLVITVAYLIFWGPLFMVTLLNWNWEFEEVRPLVRQLVKQLVRQLVRPMVSQLVRQLVSQLFRKLIRQLFR